MMIDRSVLLQQLGVQTWYAHYQLAARNSPGFACALPPAALETERTSKTSSNLAANVKAMLVAVEKPAFVEVANSLPVRPIIEVPVPLVAEREIVALKISFSAPLQPIADFELACYSAGALMIFSAEAQYDQDRQQALLLNILKACALEEFSLGYHGSFCWPVFRGEKIEADQNALLPGLLARWRHQSTAQTPVAFLCFGLSSALRTVLIDASKHELVAVDLSCSLSSLLREPVGKARVWRELKAALPALKSALNGVSV